MTASRWIPAGVIVVLLGGLAWWVLQGVERLVDTPGGTPTTAAAPPPGTPLITATLFYASADGQMLVPVQQEVPLAEGTIPQGREILTAQLQSAPPPPYVSVFPEGTVLRAFYTTGRGDAFVDLSTDVSLNHSGGTATELLTVYAIVNAVTANLPAVQRVQILIDGLEADTLAGHVDLRRPLRQDMSLVRDTAAP
jgi:hypothetical protein